MLCARHDSTGVMTTFIVLRSKRRALMVSISGRALANHAGGEPVDPQDSFQNSAVF